MTSQDTGPATPAGFPRGWNQTATPYERDARIDEVVADRVRETPDAVAIEDGERRFSYGEVSRRADAVARSVSQYLDGDDQCVGVLADRSAEAVIAFLGVMRAGAAFVPLEPGHPITRLRFMLDDTQARLVLTPRQLGNLAREITDGPVVSIDPPDDGAAAPVVGRDRTGPTSLAYVMYTSGSTGRPKGVAVEHRGVLRYVRGAGDLVARREDAVLQVGQLGFDASTYEIWSALCNGARLVIHPGGRFDPVEVARTITEHGVTVAMFSAGALHLMVDGALDALAGFRLIISAGDVLSPGHASRLRAEHPAVRLVNAYGPTESSVSASVYEVDVVSSGRSVPIGRPLANTTLYVLDGVGEPCAPGVSGELYIGGDGVVRGYLGLEELNTEKFVADPFGPPGGRLYRSGDLVRMLESGDLEFLGRLDDQVKIRGYLVEPAEVAAAISGHSGVNEVEVVARDTPSGSRQLVAYVTVSSNIDGAQLRRYVARRLPDYMVPSRIVILDEMPQTPIGKHDRAALESLSPGAPKRPPTSPTERVVARLWTEVLRHDDASADDDFFEAGGDSLSALHFIALVERDIGVSLPLATMLEERSLARLSWAIDVARAGPGQTAETRLPSLAAAPSGIQRASITQAQVCFLSELADDALPYQSNAVIDFVGPLDPALLQRALQAVVDNHDVLRTSFIKSLGVRMLRVNERVTVDLPFFDLREAPDPHEAASATCDEFFAQRLDLMSAPLVRWALIRVSEENWTLAQLEHHVVHDGWSFATLTGEIVATYRAFAAGRPSPLSPPPFQYRDFAAWQNCFAESDAGRRQLDHWRAVLSDVSAPPDLAADRPHPLQRSYRGSTLRRRLSADLVDRVHELALRSGTTPYVVTMTAFLTLLAKVSGVDDIVIGSGVANRRLAGTESLVGMLVNSVVIRTTLSGDQLISDALEAVSRVTAEALDTQEIPFEVVVRELDPRRRPGHHPFFDHLFSFHDTPFPDLDLDGIDVRVTDTLSNGSAKSDLNVIVINDRGRDALRTGTGDGELTVVWEYSEDVFDAGTSECLLDAYVQLLDHLTGDVARTLGDLDLASPAQREELVGVGPSAESHATVDQVFSDRVGEDAHAVAVWANGMTLTYGELDAASERFARRLATLGVEPGERVGVLDDRSIPMVVAVLGVLKAGAAFVGIDRMSPEGRQIRTLRDADVRLVCGSEGSYSEAMRWGVDVVEVDATGFGATHIAVSRSPSVFDRTSHTAHDPAYISFTSGSSGSPLGVEVSHLGVVRLVVDNHFVFLRRDDVVLASTPLAHSAAVFEILGALLTGAQVVIASPGPWTADELTDIITANGVTTVLLSAGVLHQLVDSRSEGLTRLRQVMVGGDELSTVHVNSLLATLRPGSTFVRVYGPTESTIFALSFDLVARERIEGPLPLGRTVPGTTAVIVDSHGHLVPDRLPGELWLGGASVALGYASEPELTAQRFVANPFGGSIGPRLFRSGDRVRRREGLVQYIGRVDRQVRVRGLRVEPQEVEEALLTVRGVGEAFVQSAEFGRDDTRLVGYLVGSRAASDAEPSNDTPDLSADTWLPDYRSIRDVLLTLLPPYMVPASFVWVDSLPRHVDGSVDVARLPEPPSAWHPVESADPMTALEEVVVRPVDGATRVEQNLIAIWQEVLGVRRIALSDDFFDLGGHSLLALELLAAVERTFGARLRLADIFEAPTVAQMARLLESQGRGAKLGSLVPLTTSGERTPIFAVTAGDGNVVGFGPLARRLGPDQPFFALQPHGLDSPDPPHRSIEAMARHYVREIRRVQPSGPYVLVGRCFGSLVAYEMSRRLEAAGESVALLASIDSGGPMWSDRQLADGTPYDVAMNEARHWGTENGFTFGDVFSEPDAARAFLSWLHEPMWTSGQVTVNRYVYAAFLGRADVQSAYGISEDGAPVDLEGMLDWAWLSGRREMGMQAALLPAHARKHSNPPASSEPSAVSRGRHTLERSMDWANFLSRGKFARLANRRRDKVIEIATENVARYRAGPLRAPVVLLHSTAYYDAHRRLEIAKWYGVQVGGLEVRQIEAGHYGIMREPTVAVLADTLRGCIDEALATVGQH